MPVHKRSGRQQRHALAVVGVERRLLLAGPAPPDARAEQVGVHTAPAEPVMIEGYRMEGWPPGGTRIVNWD